MVENSVFPKLGRGNWQSCTEKVIEGIKWAKDPWEPYVAMSNGSSTSSKVEPGDMIPPESATIVCESSSDMPTIAGRSVDLVITDPPFGDNFIYSEMAERFQKLKQRPRKEMKTEIDQAHFLIGAALPASGVNLENELAKNTWIVRRTVEAVLLWYSQTAVEPEIREAATLAATLLRRSIEERRTQLRDEQGVLFDDLEEKN